MIPIPAARDTANHAAMYHAGSVTNTANTIALRLTIRRLRVVVIAGL
jgi:hypothetical protein